MLGLTFDLIRRLNQYHANQAEHVWKAMGNIISVEGSTILVLGLGDIGGDYARKGHAVGGVHLSVSAARNGISRITWMSSTRWMIWICS